MTSAFGFPSSLRKLVFRPMLKFYLILKEQADTILVLVTPSRRQLSSWYYAAFDVPVTSFQLNISGKNLMLHG